MAVDLPPELAQFVVLLDAQPEPVQTIFRYCLALLMVEAGKAHLVSTEPSEAGAMCTFKTMTGDVFTLLKPPLSEAEEAEVKRILRAILDEESAED